MKKEQKSASYFDGVENNTQSYRIKDLFRDWTDREIVIPPFQRNYEYNVEQKISVINSILMNISLDTLTVVRPFQSSDRILCDGFHRLRTIVEFLNDSFQYNSSYCTDTLKWFSQNGPFDTKELNGKKFSEFPKLARQQLLEYRVSVCEIIIKSPEISKNKVIAFLMEQKNSCSAPVSKKRMKLNRTFIFKESLIPSWDKLNSEIEMKFGRNSLVSKAMNNDTTSETFSLALKFLDYDKPLVDKMVEGILFYSKRISVKRSLLDVGHNIKKSIVIMAVASKINASTENVIYNISKIYDTLERLETNNRNSMSPSNLFYFFTKIFNLTNQFSKGLLTDKRILTMSRINIWLQENPSILMSINQSLSKKQNHFKK